MLSRENTELLCHVGAGTVMGDMMRQYWLPCVYSWELTPDGDPVRVRMLGEDLIAWRDSNGTPSFVANNCPHRGASLFFGRNEESGLRCVYHGWKFDTSGECVDMPNEPAESDFKTKVKAVSYRGADAGGITWVYMGQLQADHIDPGDSAGVGAAIADRFDFRFEVGLSRFVGHVDAFTARVEFPTVVDAAQARLLVAPEEQRRAAVRAVVGDKAGRAVGIAPGNEVLAQHADADRVAI